MRYCPATGFTTSISDTTAKILFLMNHFNRIEPNRDLGGIQPGKNRSQKHSSQRAHQNKSWPVELNRPAKRLLVDYINQNERKREAQKKSHQIRQQADQPRFPQNQFSNLRSCRAQK